MTALRNRNGMNSSRERWTKIAHERFKHEAVGAFSIFVWCTKRTIWNSYIARNILLIGKSVGDMLHGLHKSVYRKVYPMDIHDDSGWLVSANTKSTVDIDESDLEKLLQLADLENQWAENVKNEVCDYDKNRVEAEGNF